MAGAGRTFSEDKELEKLIMALLPEGENAYENDLGSRPCDLACEIAWEIHDAVHSKPGPGRLAQGTAGRGPRHASIDFVYILMERLGFVKEDRTLTEKAMGIYNRLRERNYYADKGDVE